MSKRNSYEVWIDLDYGSGFARNGVWFRYTGSDSGVFYLGALEDLYFIIIMKVSVDTNEYPSRTSEIVALY